MIFLTHTHASKLTLLSLSLANVDYSTPSPVIVMFEGMVGTSTLSVEILHRSGYQGNRNFSLVLRNTEQGAVLFGEQRELVWILDDDGVCVCVWS